MKFTSGQKVRFTEGFEGIQIRQRGDVLESRKAIPGFCVEEVRILGEDGEVHFVNASKCDLFVEARPVDELVSGRREAISGKICMCCAKLVGKFKDTISVREFNITGYCQTCQDNVFDSVEP